MIAADFREKARKSLDGKWKPAIIVSLIYTLIICVLNWVATFKIIGILVSIATVVISPALMYGVTYAYMKIKKGEEVKPLDFLKLGFDNFGRSWGLTGHILLKCLPYVIALVVLYIALIIAIVSTYALGMATVLSPTEMIAASNAAGALGTAGITIILAIATVIVTIFFMIKALYYILSTYLAIDKPEMITKECVQKSEDLMKENRWRYFCLVFSFIGWAILAGIVGWLCAKIVGFIHFGLVTTFASELGAIALAPYIAFATIAFYEDRTGKKDNAVEASSKEKNETDSNPEA